MSNMSASILRELVSRVFKIDSLNVILSGEIRPDWEGHSGFSYGSMWEKKEEVSIWGFNPHRGFCRLNIVGEISQQGADAPVYRDGEIPLLKVKEIEEYLFFVVNEKEYYSDNQRSENSDLWTLYKAPNFKEYLQKIEAIDIQKWKSWLS